MTAPIRRRNVFFLGAGFGRTAGLPNTAELLTEVHRLAREKAAWGISKNLEERLNNAYSFFYPTRGEGFRPEVVDFFSVLTSYLQIDQGSLPEGFDDRSLLSDLRFAITHVLCDALKKVSDEDLCKPHPLLDRMLQKGTVVVTTNWDTLVERGCAARGISYRLRGYPEDGAVTILKLHGSIDWLLRSDAKRIPFGKKWYAHLDDLMQSERARFRRVSGQEVVRARVDKPTTTWRTIKGSTNDPFMITMAPGKAESLGPLLDLWEAAYRGISSARRLEIIGYSMPEDDIEIRTLLRAGVHRGGADPVVQVRNPAPDVHIRIKEMIQTDAISDYTAVRPI